MPESENLLEYAVLGKQLENFWDSDVGNYLRARAATEYTAAVEELKSCDPTDSKLVMRLQGRVWQAEKFQAWINEGIEAGLRAQEILENYESSVED